MDYQNIDWSKVWIEQMEKHLQCGNKKKASIWEDKESAKRFWEMSQKDNQKRARETIRTLNITPQSRVLDIGAGPGTLAIPLSKEVNHITAVEPSMGMIEVFEENMGDYGCNNISIVKKRWEDIDVEKDLDGPYDVVIASFSLGMPDIRKSIEDMLAVASGHIYLYWFAGETSWDRHSRNIWLQLHGKEYYPTPKCDIIYNLLYQMGIYPNMETFTLGRTEVYSSMNEVINNLSNHFSVSTDNQQEILEQYMEKTLRKENGNYIYDARSTRVKMWWNTQDY
ncbi:class I SAM-dependent methyltransferase [uncultured Methanolobus sp.]|uniref:class I SAM-dependent methyltransferase n=1 Tax=uncultured Methanolobus sp. TaxID=218300 RepID=UPI0029C8CF78|nr:class I SAM-dependent methyltransferase [uncultured Methanolobus sp.]